jgi:nucleoside-diphosphate-sugar epimerase
MEMVAINPSNVFGPVLDSHYHTSLEWFRTLMKAEIPGVPRMLLPLVDVRDLADILARAITVPEAAGKRFICNAATIPLSEFADILDENFASRGYRIPKRVLPDLLFHFLALFNPKVRAVAANLDWQYSLSTEQARSVFGWQPLPYKQTILDMAESLIEHSLA